MKAAIAGHQLARQYQGAHHRRPRERNHERDHHRRRKRERELVEQAPDDPAEEDQRREDRDQRQANREHGEPNLVRPSDCSLNARHPWSRQREMFSRTTIASSTTNPVEMISAISDS